MPGELVQLGTIVAPHGIRGAVKVKTFTASPENLVAYGPLFDQSASRRYRARLLSAGKGSAVLTLEGVTDRNQAEALRGQGLYVPRQALPKPAEDEYYHADLIGLEAQTVGGETLGRVVAIHDHGAGDVVEIAGSRGGSLLFPFSRAVVPLVDIAGGRLVVDPPVEVEARGDGADG